MRHVVTTVPALATAALLAVSLHAQDATIKSKTQTKVDDAKTITMTGCLDSAVGASSYTLSRVVMERSSTEKSSDVPAIGTSGTIASYELVPKAGVDLTAHAGHKVTITGVMVSAATKTDDDADVKVKDKTKTKVDDAPDQKVESKSKAEIARGSMPKINVLSVQMVAPSCS
jgi:hypothetical protein